MTGPKNAPLPVCRTGRPSVNPLPNYWAPHAITGRLLARPKDATAVRCFYCRIVYWALFLASACLERCFYPQLCFSRRYLIIVLECTPEGPRTASCCSARRAWTPFPCKNNGCLSLPCKKRPSGLQEKPGCPAGKPEVISIIPGSLLLWCVSDGKNETKHRL